MAIHDLRRSVSTMRAEHNGEHYGQRYHRFGTYLDSHDLHENCLDSHGRHGNCLVLVAGSDSELDLQWQGGTVTGVAR